MGFQSFDYVILALATTLWCVLHSLTVGSTWTDFLKQHMGNAYRFYRVLFNLFAFVTLVPIVIFENRIDGVLFFPESRAVRVVQAILLVVAAVLFYFGGREYDLKSFLGVRQIRAGEDRKTLTTGGGLHTDGLLGWIRHPWYTGAMAFLWSRSLDSATVVVNIVLSAYLIVGTLLEERKLVAEFGEDYVKYQREVGMFLPFRRSPTTGR